MASKSASGRRGCEVLGLGQAMIDLGGNVEEEGLVGFGLAKGERRVVSAEEQVELISKLDGNYEVRPGSSVCNTLVALSRLSNADGRGVKCGMAGCLGSDMQGDLFREQLARTGVDFLSTPAPKTRTGCVIVLTTPDAQRSFLAFPGSTEYAVDAGVVSAIAQARVLLVEGYLLELEGGLERVGKAIRAARENGTVVALTAGDPGLVVRQREIFTKVLQMGVDILFANHAEAAGLLGEDEDGIAPDKAAQELSKICSLVAVTDGRRGSCISGMGRLSVVPPFWRKEPPVDTCGAGDAYAGGLLFGFLKGMDLHGMGQVAARAASAVISDFGGRLSEMHAQEVIGSLAKNVVGEGGVQGKEGVQVAITGRDLIKTG